MQHRPLYAADRDRDDGGSTIDVGAPGTDWQPPTSSTRAPDDGSQARSSWTRCLHPSSTPMQLRPSTSNGVQFVNQAPPTVAQTLRRGVERIAAESTVPLPGAATPPVVFATDVFGDPASAGWGAEQAIDETFEAHFSARPGYHYAGGTYTEQLRDPLAGRYHCAGWLRRGDQQGGVRSPGHAEHRRPQLRPDDPASVDRPRARQIFGTPW